MSGPSLRELEDDERAAAVMANLAPKSWRDAVSAYFATRKEKVLGDIDRLSEFEVIQRTYRVEALHKLHGIVQPLRKNKTLKELPGAATLDEKRMRLATLLTPSGWREEFMEPFEKAKKNALDSILKRQDIPQNQAIISEINLLCRFLSRVQQDATAAVVRRQKELKVVNGRR